MKLFLTHNFSLFLPFDDPYLQQGRHNIYDLQQQRNFSWTDWHGIRIHAEETDWLPCHEMAKTILTGMWVCMEQGSNHPHPRQQYLDTGIPDASDPDQQPLDPVGRRRRSQPIPLRNIGKRGKIVNTYCHKKWPAISHIDSRIGSPPPPPLTHPIMTAHSGDITRTHGRLIQHIIY